MSTPHWQLKLEQVEFSNRDKPDKIIEWLLNDPVAKDIPEAILQARLNRHGYVKPKPPVKKRQPRKPREVSKNVKQTRA